MKMKKMQMRGIASLLVGLLCGAPAFGEIIVTLEDQQILPDTPDQQIDILVTGDERITGVILRLAIGDGRSGAVVTDVDLVNGTVFEPAPFPGFSTRLPISEGEFQIIVFDLNSAVTDVEANGLLATVTVSTEGVTSGDFTLSLVSPTFGPTQFADVAGEPVDEDNVSLPDEAPPIPEPSGCIAWLALMAGFTSWQRRSSMARPTNFE